MDQQRYKWGDKNIRKQKVAHENASMTLDKSQYERADTECAGISEKRKVVG
jgi:hypothetical protein